MPRKGEGMHARAGAQMIEEPATMPVTDFDLAELYGSAGALARSMQGEFDPRRFLEALSSQVRQVIPHDRLTLLYLEEHARTFSVFGEHAFGDHAAGGALRHEGHYTIGCAPGSRHTSQQIAHLRSF